MPSSGPNATIQNSPPLVTSNKARVKSGLPPVVDAEGAPSSFAPLLFDVLRPQRLAAPVKVYVEQCSAHPLERDVEARSNFSRERRNTEDKPVFEIKLTRQDGLYPLRYAARRSNGGAWEEECAEARAPDDFANLPTMLSGEKLRRRIV